MVFSFLTFVVTGQTKDIIPPDFSKVDSIVGRNKQINCQLKNHKCTEIHYRISTIKNEIDSVLIVYCFYDDKRKKVIHKY